MTEIASGEQDDPPSPETWSAEQPLALGAVIDEAATDYSSIDQFAHLVGREPAIVMTFQDWEKNAAF